MPSDAKFVGIDWAKHGWFSVGFDAGGGYGFQFGMFSDLIDHYGGASLILVDIPIGLSEGGPQERACDVLARRLVRPRGSSVFPAPTRQAVHKVTYQAGSSTNAALTGKKLSRQSWRIAPGIQEVDELIQSLDGPRRERVREVHPEVCFWALNGKNPLANAKKKAQGQEERVRILERIEPQTRDMLRDALRDHERHAAADDVLDALAAALTAREGYPDKLQTVPDEPPRDARGLPMEMVFYNPTP